MHQLPSLRAASPCPQNEITGDVQYEDPGNTPFEDNNGVRFWISNGQRVHEDPTRGQYTW